MKVVALSWMSRVVGAFVQQWADTFIFVELELHLAESRSALDQVIVKVDSILVVFEPKGVALAEEMQAYMDAAQDHLKTFVKQAVGDSVQFAMALMKSHIPKADLGPVGDGVAPDCTDDEWAVHFDSAKPLADCIMT
jgi:hypothetical protein